FAEAMCGSLCLSAYSFGDSLPYFQIRRIRGYTTPVLLRSFGSRQMDYLQFQPPVYFQNPSIIQSESQDCIYLSLPHPYSTSPHWGRLCHSMRYGRSHMAEKQTATTWVRGSKAVSTSGHLHRVLGIHITDFKAQSCSKPL